MTCSALRPEGVEVSHVKAEKGVLFRRRSLEETLEETHPGKSLNGGQTGL